ncbi:hypothetical protein X975_24883, partial [Stegodyphus mimosarum]
MHKEIINCQRHFNSTQKKLNLNGDKNSLKVAFRDISQKTIKDNAVHMDVELQLLPSKHQRIQESIIMPNFQDRIKTIIASALKDSSAQDKNDPEKMKQNYAQNSVGNSLLSPRNNFPEILSHKQEYSSENQTGSSRTKYSSLSFQGKSDQVNFLSVSQKDFKENGNGFKRVELSDPEVSSSLTNAAYSPISPSRTPPTSSSPVFQVQESVTKSVLSNYTINLGLSVNNNILSGEYPSKNRTSEAECLNLPSHEKNKSDSLSDTHSKIRPTRISPFSHIVEQSKPKQALDEIKVKNGFSLNSKFHSHITSSTLRRDEQSARKKSKYHTSFDSTKERKIKP